MKILIVEDDLLISRLLIRHLKEAGHEITNSVRTLSDAIKSLRKDPPDFAILDISLGNAQNTDGIELANWIGKFLHIPFLFLTGKDSPPPEVAFTQSYAYIKKPYDKDQLLIQIRFIQDRFAESRAVGQHDYARNSVYLHVNSDYKQIRFDELLYVQANRNKVIIHTISTGDNPHVIGTHLGDISRFFVHPLLVSLPPSLMINHQYIKVVGSTEVELQVGDKIRKVSLTGKARKLLIDQLNVVKTRSKNV